jgi:beta-1,4-mannosyl-glycoprotein beta-1,4-N-acetylglucosaminyltransferase
MKIIDCLIYNNEIELLKARLDYLQDICDLHIIVEADRFFSGSFREFSGTEIEELRSQYPGKIVWVKYSDNLENASPWEREANQRNHIGNYLKDLGQDDLILLSDVDEIPSKQFITQAKNRLPQYSIAMMDHFQYCIHGMNPNYSHTTIAFGPQNLDLTIQQLRLRAIRFWENPQEVITNAGWHLSSFGNPEDFVHKIRSFSHQEFNRFPYTTKSWVRLLQYLGLQIDGTCFLNFVSHPEIPFETGFECRQKHRILIGRILRSVIQPIVAITFKLIVKEISTPFTMESIKTIPEAK